jgi:hypothetical protein
MQVVQPLIDSDFMLQARARQAETTLGTVTVTVDTSQCSKQVKPDIAGVIADELAAGILLALQNRGRKATFDYVHGVNGSITPGQIAYDLKGTIDVVLPVLGVVTVNDELTGSFGLTVDRSRDQLAPINESHNVNCSVDALTWAGWIATGAFAGAAWGGLSGLIGGVFGAVVGIIWGAVVGIVTAASTLQFLINTVSNDISAAIPGGIPILVQRVIANFFSEPAGMAMATVSIDPDPPNAPEGNITVTFCPKAPGVRGALGGGVLA